MSFYRVKLLESEYVVLKEVGKEKNPQSVILNYTVIGEYRSTLGRSKVIFSLPLHMKNCQHLNKQRQGDERKAYGFNSWKLYCDTGIFRKEDPEDSSRAFYFHAHVLGSNGLPCRHVST